MTLRVIYSWIHGGKQIRFDFTHRPASVSNFDPLVRPVKYDQNVQMKQAEQITGSFKRLKKE